MLPQYYFNIDNKWEMFLDDKISILEWSCVTDDYNNEFSFAITGISYIFKYTSIVILNCNNILHYYEMYYYFNQIKAALVIDVNRQ